MRAGGRVAAALETDGRVLLPSQPGCESRPPCSLCSRCSSEAERRSRSSLPRPSRSRPRRSSSRRSSSRRRPSRLSPSCPRLSRRSSCRCPTHRRLSASGRRSSRPASWSRRERSGQGDPPLDLSGSAVRGLPGRGWDGVRARLSGWGLWPFRRQDRGGGPGSGRSGRGRGGRTGRGSGPASGGSAEGLRTGGRSTEGLRITAGWRRAGRRWTAATTPPRSSSSEAVAPFPDRRGGGAAAGARDRPPDGSARPRFGGSTWMTPGRPRSGRGGSGSSDTGWVIDSASSSLVAIMAASDAAASDATPMATTSDVLRRDDTRGDPLRRRTGGCRPGNHRQPGRYT